VEKYTGEKIAQRFRADLAPVRDERHERERRDTREEESRLLFRDPEKNPERRDTHSDKKQMRRLESPDKKHEIEKHARKPVVVDHRKIRVGVRVGIGADGKPMLKKKPAVRYVSSQISRNQIRSVQQKKRVE